MTDQKGGTALPHNSINIIRLELGVASECSPERF